MSTIVTSNVSDGTLSIPTTYVTNGSAKVWVNFNGTGTIAARDSFNVASLTDGGTGTYTVNFANAMAAGDYMTAGSCRTPGALSGAALQFDVYSTTSILFYTRGSTTGAEADFSIVTMSAHGDLA